MAQEDLRPDSRLQDPTYAAGLGQKGGIASGKSRRKKANFKAAAEMLLRLKMPTSHLGEFLEKNGIEPTFENGVIFSAIFKGVKNGDIQAVMKLREITGQDKTTLDIQEQRAKVRKMKRENEADTKRTGHPCA